MVETPTRSRIEGWTTGHLKSAALDWERQANLTGQLYTQAQHAVDTAPWTGAAADQASAKLFANLVKIRGALDHLRQAEKIATAGADTIDAAKRDAVAAIKHALEQFFAVAEDLTVTERMPPIFGAPLAVVRMLAAAHFQADIRAKAMILTQTDEKVAGQLDAICPHPPRVRHGGRQGRRTRRRPSARSANRRRPNAIAAGWHAGRLERHDSRQRGRDQWRRADRLSNAERRAQPS